MHRLSGCSCQPSSLVEQAVGGGGGEKGHGILGRGGQISFGVAASWINLQPRPTPTPRWINASGRDNLLLSFITDQINALTPTSNIGLPRANYLLEMFAEITAVLSSGFLIGSKRR